MDNGNSMDSHVDATMQNAVNASSITGNDRQSASLRVPLWQMLVALFMLGVILVSYVAFLPKYLSEDNYLKLEEYLNSEWAFLYGDGIGSKNFRGGPISHMPMFLTSKRIYYSDSFKYDTPEDKVMALEENLLSDSQIFHVYDDKEFLYLLPENTSFIRRLTVGRRYTKAGQIFKMDLVESLPDEAKYMRSYQYDGGYKLLEKEGK